jgi:hypothetical protein
MWSERQEYAWEIGDVQATSDSSDQAGADLLNVDASINSMTQAPLGNPPLDFDVISTYDSRPVNAYDFNFSASVTATLGVVWTMTFNVPPGYRAVPREWDVTYDTPFVGPSNGSTVSLLQGSAGVPNNGPIIIGSGTFDPIKSFFICEEQTTFGITGIAIGGGANGVGPNTSNVSVNVWGNLIPVSEVALPFTVANEGRMAGVSGL